jgi:hypothetical protein
LENKSKIGTHHWHATMVIHADIAAGTTYVFDVELLSEIFPT